MCMKDLFLFIIINSKIFTRKYIILQTLSMIVEGIFEPTYLYQNTHIFSYLQGCLGEIRIGGLLLPFFTNKELKSNSHYSQEFYELISDSKPEIDCILCYDTDCFNQGQCISPEETYKCDCPAGYAADDCSIDINECLNNQCQNNATCVDLVARYRCDCQIGYDGEQWVFEGILVVSCHNWWNYEICDGDFWKMIQIYMR